MTADRLRTIHAVLRHAAERGCEFLPTPHVTQEGETFIGHEARLYEVAAWLPGAPDPAAIAPPRRLANAMQALARFHLAVGAGGGPLQPAPAVARRAERLRWFGNGGCDAIAQAVAREPAAPLAIHAAPALDHFEREAPAVVRELESCVEEPVSVLPCIHDLKRDHVLFTGDRVTGMLDFDALRDDTASVDVARLLGSFAGDELESWERGIVAYTSLRPLSHAEVSLCRLLDRANVLLGPLQWLHWIFVERRPFEDWNRVGERLEGMVARIPAPAAR